MTEVPAISPRTAFLNIRQPQKRAFLRAFAETGHIGKSAEVAGIHRDTHYDWLKDEAYAEAFKKATLMVGAKFEEEIYRRGFEGDERTVWHKGKKVGSYKIYSDLLAIFALKGIFPDKYKDNQPGANFSGPTQINITIKNEPSKFRTPQDLITCDDKKDEQD